MPAEGGGRSSRRPPLFMTQTATEPTWRGFKDSPDVEEGWYLKSDFDDVSDCRAGVWVAKDKSGHFRAHPQCPATDGGYHLADSGGGFMFGPLEFPKESGMWVKSDSGVQWEEGWYGISTDPKTKGCECMEYVVVDGSGAPKFSSSPNTSLYGRSLDDLIVRYVFRVLLEP